MPDTPAPARPTIRAVANLIRSLPSDAQPNLVWLSMAPVDHRRLRDELKRDINLEDLTNDRSAKPDILTIMGWRICENDAVDPGIVCITALIIGGYERLVAAKNLFRVDLSAPLRDDHG